MTTGAPHIRPHIRIVMATRNGAAHLAAQLDSFAAQSHTDWSLDVSDDGSSDATRQILSAFRAAHPGRVRVFDGPGQGAAANFLTAAARAVADAPGAALGFADQDDVWLPDKLARAAHWIAEQDRAGQEMGQDVGQGAVPAVWVCRTVLTDAALRPIGESRVFARPPAFGNALVQNILAGNTIVLSPAGAAALARTVPAALDARVPYHDWWVYQVMTGIGARIGMEPEPLVLYRQHGTNTLGHHGPVRGRLKRLGIVAKRDYSSWISANLTALRAHDGMLTPEARRTLRQVMMARRRGGQALAAALPRLGLHRQSPRGDQMLRMMALTGRL